jgi:hypothetical protein
MEKFKIYDNEGKVFDEDVIVEATNAREALQKHLDSLALKLKFKRSGNNKVRFKVFKMATESQNASRSTWFKII